MEKTYTTASVSGRDSHLERIARLEARLDYLSREIERLEKCIQRTLTSALMLGLPTLLGLLGYFGARFLERIQ